MSLFKAKVVDALQALGEATVADVAQHTGFDPESVRKCMAKMRDAHPAECHVARYEVRPTADNTPFGCYRVSVFAPGPSTGAKTLTVSFIGRSLKGQP